MENDNKLKVLNEFGELVEYEIIGTAVGDDGKEYIFFTDLSVDSDGKIRMFNAIYDRLNGTLSPIENESETEMANKVFNILQEEMIAIQKERERIEKWISEMNEKIGSSQNQDLSQYAVEIIDLLMDEEFDDYIDELFSLLKQVMKTSDNAKKEYMRIAKRAYKEERYLLAELAFTEADAKAYLAHMMRRKEIEDISKYSKREIGKLLEDGVKQKDDFSMINMSLFCALDIGDDDSWNLADSIMSNISEENINEMYNFWLDISKKGGVEADLVHYWMLKYKKISKSELGTMFRIRKKLEKLIPTMPDYI